MRQPSSAIENDGGPALPRISPLLLRWFSWYSRGYLRRHFHSLRISRAGLPPSTKGRPLVIYTASVWGLGLGGGCVRGFDVGGHVPAALHGARGFWVAGTAGLAVAAAGLVALLWPRMGEGAFY